MSFEIVLGEEEIDRGSSVEAISSKYKEFPLVLDAQTDKWIVMYFPLSWATYGVRYEAELRIIDTKKKLIVTQGSCVVQPEKRDDSPGYDEMLGNGGQRFKDEMTLVIKKCVQQLVGG